MYTSSSFCIFWKKFFVLEKGLGAEVSKNVFGLEIRVGKEIKSTLIKKTFLRVVHFKKNMNSICD